MLFAASICGILEGYGNAASPPLWIKRSQAFNRAFWVLANLTAIGVWELKSNYSHFDYIDDSTIWIVSTALVTISRAVSPLHMIVTQLFSSKDMTMIAAVRVCLGKWWKLMLALQLSMRFALCMLPTASPLNHFAFFLPSLVKSRLDVTMLAYATVIGSSLLIAALLPLRQTSKAIGKDQ